MTFLDTSAMLSLLDADERHHAACAETWRALVTEDEHLFTTNYVLVESFALVQRRLGLDALQVLCGHFLPLVEVIWLDRVIHDAAVSAVLTAARRKLSFVDCVSFEVMRRQGATRAFTLDGHFEEQGFVRIPA